MSKSTLSRRAAIGGLSIGESVTVESQVYATVDLSGDSTIPAAKAGVLTTRTDDDTGLITTTAVHGLQVGDRVDIYWSGGIRRGMLVSAVGSTTTITVGTGVGDVGAGDVFPVATTAVVVGKCIECTCAFDGDDLNIFAAGFSRSEGCVVFAETDNSEILAYRLLGPSLIAQWDNAHGVTNPLAAAAVAKIFASNGNSSNANDFKFAGGLDN